MDYEYIIAIAAGGVFLVLLISYICRHAVTSKRKKTDDAALAKYYADPNILRMDYDVAAYPAAKKSTEPGQVSIFEIMSESDEGVQSLPFGRMTRETVEEIVGTYEETEDSDVSI
ncbi:MAG: hypothetical protein LUD29_01950 [Clostridia bacterium]|nr:hypothetical protein [Clostridia bacterium]